MTTFDKLGIAKPILSALTDCGYEVPTLIQEKAIPAGLAGRDVLGSAQTGTGKTCAFGVPILQRLNKAGHKKDRIRALILTPTRELAIQIDDNLKDYGKNLPLKEAMEEAEIQYIYRTLERNDGNTSVTAEKHGISRTTLWRRRGAGR